MTIQGALSAAAAASGADVVHIDTGSYSEANLAYSSSDPANVVRVEGEGMLQTLLTMPNTLGSQTGLTVDGPAGTSVGSLAMTIPANADGNGDTGIRLQGADGLLLRVNGPAADNASGILLGDGITLTSSTVNLQDGPSGNIGIDAQGSDASVLNSTSTANVPVRAGGVSATTIIDRSVLKPFAAGVALDSGGAFVENSVIDLGMDPDAVGVFAVNTNQGVDPISVNVLGSTIAGGGASSVGVYAEGDSDATMPVDGTDMTNDGETSTVTVNSTVISGPSVSIKVQADRGEIATVSTDYSNYNTLNTVVNSDLTPGGGVGTATLNETNRTNYMPDFVNPAGGDYHLMSTSQLIDIGDPDPAPGVQDIDGDARVIFGKDNCTGAQRDIGADEFVPSMTPTVLDCVAPQTSIVSGPTGPTNDNTPTFGFTADETPVTFQCSVNGGMFAACPASFTSPVLADGPYTLSVRATDASLNQDASPATRSFTVDTKTPDTTASGPSKLKLKKKTKKKTATYSLSSTEAGVTFQCSLDGGSFTSCSPSHSVTLKKGTHTLSVRATDAAGNGDSTPATVTTRVVKKKRKK